jgi:CheY-like chemotaxis protein
MAKIRVVVVDDSALVRSLLTEIINRQHDMQCVGAAADPLVAREMIRELNPDVITLDVEMPRMDGLEFLSRLMRLRPMPVVMVSTLTEQGKRVAGYGAPAKGNTLLGFLDIGPDMVEYIADRSPLKQGLYTPGMHIPVVPPERLLADQPDYVILFAWNFVDEILEQQAEYRSRGGRFIIPVPDIVIV